MKERITYILSLIVPVLVSAACAKQNDLPADGQGEPVYMEFHVGDGSGLVSKTYSVGNSVFWEEGDAINIFAGTVSNRFATEDSGASVTFKGITPTAGTYYALYPYQPGASCASGVITATIPTEQKAVAGTFGPGADLTVGSTTGTSLSMSHVPGFAKIITTRDYKKITMTAMGGCRIAGEVKITVGSAPDVSTTSSSVSSIDLVPSSGTTIPAGTYYIALAPGSLTNGARFVFTDSADKTYVTADTELQKGQTVGRRKSLAFGKIDSDIKEASMDISVDESKTKTTIPAGETTAKLYLSSLSTGITATIKPDATLTGATITKVNDLEYTISGITNSSDDPAKFNTLTVVCKADGVADKEITFKQNGPLKWVFYDGSTLKTFGLPSANPAAGTPGTTPAARMDALTTSAGNSYYLYYMGHVYSRNATSSSGIAINCGTKDNGQVLFPALSGLALSKVEIVYRYHSSFKATSQSIRSAGAVSYDTAANTASFTVNFSDWYTGLFSYPAGFTSGNLTHTFVLGTIRDGETCDVSADKVKSGEAGREYVLSQNAKTTVMRSITLYYE